MLTKEIAVVLALLGFTAYLFISERVRADVAAIVVLSLLGVLSITPGFEAVVSGATLFAGFSSDAVIAIIAVMIISGGLDKTGVMSRLAGWIVTVGGTSEYRIVFLLSFSAGLLSAFVQNIGVIALFLPVVSRIAARTGLSVSRMLMPVGFCTILGGTITLVGCSPLIILNELLRRANGFVPPELAMKPLHLFAVAPVGFALLVVGIAYFVLAGRYILPEDRDKLSALGTRTLDYFKRVYGINAGIDEVVVPSDSPLIGTTILDAQQRFNVRIIATRYQGRVRISPPVSVKIQPPAVLAVIGEPDDVAAFAERGGLRLRSRLQSFTDSLLHTRCGVAELVIPPDSALIGKSIRGLRMRETYQLTVLAVYRAGQTLREDLPNIPFQAGDTLVCHTAWDALARLEKNRNFVVVTSEYPHEEERPHKLVSALGFFLLSLALVLLSDMRLGAAMLIGAIGMVVSGVLSMDEAYAAVSWKTIFLLAGLMPLGLAVQHSGTADWIAQLTLAIFAHVPEWVLQVVLALMASAFSLVMSNVGATILLVPVAVSIAVSAGADPTLYALIVALGTSNCFLIPTNQVNALIMGPGGYSNADFFRVGGIMTILFLIVSLLVLNAVF